jgi:thiol-disulfide isomerase/thioredoxin
VNVISRLGRRAIPACLLCCLAAPAAADAPAPPAPNPEARRLLDEVVAAYKALPSYADRGEFSVSTTIAGAPTTRTYPFHLALVRPNRIVLDAGIVRIQSDGTTLRTVVEPLKSYTEAPAPAAITLDTFVDSPMGAFLFGMPLGTPLPVLLNLLLADDPSAAILEAAGGRPRAAPDRALGDRTVKALVLDRDAGPDLLLLVDPETKLLVRIEQVLGPQAPDAGLPDGAKVSEIAVAWSSGTISTGAPQAEAFAMEPPKGFSKVASLASGRGEPAPKSKEPESELVGKPAPEFTLTVLDGAGKTRKLSKADLAGKVVLIDFWATWCPPCRKELPEIQKLIEGFDKRGETDLVVIALSLDREPADLPGVRKLVEQSLADQKLSLTGGQVGRIALDPTGALGDVFGVEGIPTVVILDRQGVVRTFHVGYDPEADVRTTLTETIDSLLKRDKP